MNASLRRTSLWLALLSLACGLFADLDISSPEPTRELLALAAGVVSPRLPDGPTLLWALGHTLAFALQAIALAALAGFALALVWHRRWVRRLAAGLRSVHEIFWALLLIQLLGLSPAAGLWALVLPYIGCLAKVYGEQLQEVDPGPARALSGRSWAGFSQLIYSRLPLAWAGFGHYTRYRFECALRSSVVLGFLGLPTLGYHLETALRLGDYSQGMGLIYLLIGLVVSLRFWLRPWPFVLALAASLWWFFPQAHWSPTGALSFLTGLVPAPLRLNLDAEQTARWAAGLGTALTTGSLNTWLLAQMALGATGLFALLAMPLNAPLMLPGWARGLGDGLLIVLRSLPEYLLNFLGLLWLGPSMLPALLAITAHNGAIIGHLLGRHSADLAGPVLPARALDCYGYYLVPSLYGQFLSYLLYRWEIIMRETAMLGLLGIPTLGFYVDSAFEALQFDKALLLIVAASALNLLADGLAQRLRSHLALKSAVNVG